MDADVYDPEDLPFGFYGPLKYKDFTVTKATNVPSTGRFALGGADILSSSIGDLDGRFIITGSQMGESAGP